MKYLSTALSFVGTSLGILSTIKGLITVGAIVGLLGGVGIWWFKGKLKDRRIRNRIHRANQATIENMKRANKVDNLILGKEAVTITVDRDEMIKKIQAPPEAIKNNEPIPTTTLPPILQIGSQKITIISKPALEVFNKVLEETNDYDAANKASAEKAKNDFIKLIQDSGSL